MRTWKRGEERVHPVILEIVTYIEFWSLSAKFKPKCIVQRLRGKCTLSVESTFASIHISTRIYYQSEEDEEVPLSFLYFAIYRRVGSFSSSFQRFLRKIHASSDCKYFNDFNCQCQYQ